MFFQILSLIKGREGTQLKMEFRRDGKDFEVELVRRHADGPQQPSILMKSEDSGPAGLENGQNCQLIPFHARLRSHAAPLSFAGAATGRPGLTRC